MSLEIFCQFIVKRKRKTKLKNKQRKKKQKKVSSICRTKVYLFSLVLGQLNCCLFVCLIKVMTKIQNAINHVYFLFSSFSFVFSFCFFGRRFFVAFFFLFLSSFNILCILTKLNFVIYLF